MHALSETSRLVARPGNMSSSRWCRQHQEVSDADQMFGGKVSMKNALSKTGRLVASPEQGLVSHWNPFETLQAAAPQVASMIQCHATPKGLIEACDA